MDSIVTAVAAPPVIAPPPKPLLRGRFHAAAAAVALLFTVALCWRSRSDPPRMLSLLIFGLSMVELYSVSALYHIGAWGPRAGRRLRALDHANIFVLIAGTYTPLCFNVLSGWLRPALLALIWALAVAGAALATLTLRTPRWLTAGLYLGMGWVSLLALPAFLHALGWLPVATLLLGGALYTVGAVVYARKRPDPFPRVFGFHEVFHLFVIAGGVAFALMVWLWVVPFPRV
ncbi:MAG: hemolysin III family protein [Ktedonobacterales bacterium]